VSNSPSFADDAVLGFFRTSTTNLLEYSAKAGVGHYVALSVVGTDRLSESGYSTSADMIFNVAYLVWHLSQYLVLDPGDLINVGTPQGVALSGRFPYLAAGDVMDIEIDGLGRQRQHLVSACESSHESR
jgi:2-keto-4-pentenoate hydratase/2-oxohepta-3-ene-1,7-dioic acid hydratase in catechol pathway